MVVKNGINPALTRPCAWCKKHIMWSERPARHRGFQVHQACLERFKSAKEAEDELLGKNDEVKPMRQVRQEPERSETDAAPRPSPEVLREPGPRADRPPLSLVPRRGGTDDTREGGTEGPVLLGRVIPFPGKR